MGSLLVTWLHVLHWLASVLCSLLAADGCHQQVNVWSDHQYLVQGFGGAQSVTAIHRPCRAAAPGVYTMETQTMS